MSRRERRSFSKEFKAKQAIPTTGSALGVNTPNRRSQRCCLRAVQAASGVEVATARGGIVGWEGLFSSPAGRYPTGPDLGESGR